MGRGMKTGGSMTGGKIAKLATGLPLWSLALAGWALALIGVAICDHYSGASNGGSTPFGFSWWVVFFDLFVLLCVMLYLVELGAGYGLSQVAVVALLAVVEVLKMLETEKWNNYRKQPDVTGRNRKGAQVAFSGWLIASIAEGLLIITLGTATHAGRNHDDKHHDHYPVTSANTASARPVGTTGTATQGTTGSSMV